jgi:Domain of unknown function (DUF6468)
MTMVLDGVIIMLLLMALGGGVILHRKISVFKGYVDKTKQLADVFFDATDKAETAIVRLTKQAGASSKELEEALIEAKKLQDELKFLYTRGEALASRLEVQVLAKKTRDVPEEHETFRAKRRSGAAQRLAEALQGGRAVFAYYLSYLS